MAEQYLNVKTVAVIGAGVSGVAAAIHLKKAGLDVTVYERSKRAGGIWVYDERTAKDANYPSNIPSVGDSPEYPNLSKAFKRGARHDSPMVNCGSVDRPCDADIATSFAPPGPCYVALKNNVSTIEMEMSCQRWNPGTDEFVPHHFMADYIQDSARNNDILSNCSFDTRVNQVRKVGESWQVDIARLEEKNGSVEVIDSTVHFDALVVATGHYHACSIPDLPGLAEWKQRYPQAVQHSKLYRSNTGFEGKNVLLIGSGVSSMDIARDLGPVARTVYQSSRGGMYDLPSQLLPDNGARIGAIESFDVLSSPGQSGDGSLPGTITLKSGEKLCNIHHVIVCTGYHVSFPFMREYHADGMRAEDADEDVIGTDGQQTHNLHKDIWYIQDPTLSFIGVPYHVATFSFFEFQAMALAAVLSGRTPLPPRAEMRAEYQDRIREKGAGRTFHSMKKTGDEIAYVDELVKMVTSGGGIMPGHTQAFREAYVRRGVRQKAIFSQIRDPELDQRVMQMVIGC